MTQLAIPQVYQLACQHHRQGNLPQAETIYRQILAQQPNHVDALHMLGVLAHQVGRSDIAIDLIGRALAGHPQFPEAQSHMGLALRGAGRLADAVASFRRAIALRPDFADAYGNLGLALKDLGQIDEAMAACRKAIALRPNYPEAYNNLGNALKERRLFEEAVAAYRQAIALRANFADAHNNLALTLKEMGMLDEALAACRAALALKPSAETHNCLGTILKDMGQMEEAIAAYRKALELHPQHANAFSNLIFALHYDPRQSAASIAEELRTWNARFAEPMRQLTPTLAHGIDRGSGRRLRIGYVSPDLLHHPVAHFLLPLLAHHDKAQFEIFCYAQVPVPDHMTERLRALADQWRSTVGLSDEQVASVIREDRIDILVDLAMHTSNNRLLVFARKPAPVQVTYLAYCSSTGLSTIDYRLSDPHLDGSPGDESHYSEQTIRLPETYWCYEPAIDTPAVSVLPASTSGQVTFGCLNNFCKISEPTWALWIKLLREVPHSQLLVHALEGSHRQRAWQRLEREGLDAKRLRFVGRVKLREYLCLYVGIDIALDTFPYNGGTTSCDALWMGVPVVSLVGRTGVGRAGLSILTNMGLPELVARSEEEYVRIAAVLANDLPRLAALRGTMRQRMQESPLMDAGRFARNVEVAYRQMWERWCGDATVGG